MIISKNVILAGGRVPRAPTNWLEGFQQLHHPARIYRMRRGNLQIHWNSKNEKLSSPGMYWIPSMGLCENWAEGDFSVDFIHLDHALLSDFPAKDELFAFSQLENEYWAHEWDDALGGESRNLSQHSGLRCMVESLLRRLNQGSITQIPSAKQSQLQPLLEEMDLFPEKRMSLSDMAARVQCSLGHFSRLFKETIGVSPQSYQRERFMNYISSRLSRGHSLKLISTDIHYSSPFALSRDFKKHFGVSPREYLKLFGNSSSQKSDTL